MFELVDDVDRYPEFLPWCVGAETHEREDGSVDASIAVARGAFRGRFTTRNRREPPRGIDLSLVDGPFRRLDGRWRFEPLEGPEADSSGCRISLELSFEIASPLLRRVLEPAFERMANEMVDAFVRRAESLAEGDDGGGR